MNGNIRVARPNDLPAIVSIYNAAIPGRLATADTEPVLVESRRDWFDEHTTDRHPLWVLERDQRIAGWLSFSRFYGRPAYAATAEVSVYVAPECQRQGVGRHLLQAAVDQAPSFGLTTLLAFIFGHNAVSLSLFTQLGFVCWAQLPKIAVLDRIERDLLIVGRRVP